MYRHQQAVAAPPANAHSWYGYHQGAQMGAEQQMWEPQMWHHHGHVPTHSVFNNGEFSEFVHSGMVHNEGHHNQLMPSPTITVSGSELSSPGAGNGSISPQNHHQTQVPRPPPARSPFEWVKRTSYQSQPNPGKTRTKDKYRVVYTDHQRVELEKEFYYSRYITIRRKAELASNLGLSERQVKIWFQNRRAKERKQVKKREEFTQKDNSMTMGHMTQQQIIHSNPTQIGQNIMTSQIM
ncbi:hypothetical protein Zmor_011681 [Zophobas morio]|uniref:Homeobox domain-containing protein n=1 Tax=Zophobas morio TaxID=2755281 RepID=A0AA38IQG9_9CUCU|nr:hypothetical protein Zmor_011681 [Zophobas morio]